jgi:CheY-like chemotaxis protein
MNPTVLIVEDEEDDVFLLKRAFAKGAPKLTVRVARDGEEAIADLERAGLTGDEVEHPLPSLVLLDLKLPRKSGLEVLQWMRARPETREVPVIIRSSSNVPSDLERAYELGCSFYILKQVGFGGLHDLAKCIGDFLEVQRRNTLRLPLFGI